jgi:uncharacterized BrkB/YihY/UPF0761 family membrane protein
LIFIHTKPVELLKQTYVDWSNRQGPRLGAALAYYAVFSLAPTLVICLAIAGLAFGASPYRAAGSVVILLIWLYYSAQILYFGAEFTQVYANQYGSRIAPEPGAQRRETGVRT